MRKFRINRSGKGVPVYLDEAGKTRLGTITANELFVDAGPNEGGQTGVFFYSPSGWKHGYVRTRPSGFQTTAYSASKAYGTHTAGYKFKVLHRQSRIFSGPSSVVAAVQPGGYIITDGKSDGGSDKAYRLSIKGFIHSGTTKYVPVANGWCDTDMETGKTMYNTVTIDGLWV